MKDILREYFDEVEGRVFVSEMNWERMSDDVIKLNMTTFAKRMVEWADCYPNRPSNFLDFMIKEVIELAKAKPGEIQTLNFLFGKTNHP